MKAINGMNGKGGLLPLEPGMMAELSQSEATFRKPIFSLKFAPFDVTKEDIADRPDICFVFGYFYLMYCHMTVQYRTKKFFRICAADASIRTFMREGDFDYRVADWDDFVEQAKKNEFFSFLLRASTISKELFDLAKANYAVRLPFTIDAVKYCKEVGQPTSLSSLEYMKVFIDKKAGTKHIIKGVRNED